MSTRDLLRTHTADLAGRHWHPHEQPLADLVTTAHDPDAPDAQAEAAALRFCHSWGDHPVYRKTARYGLILHTLRHRPELTYRTALFSRVVDDVGNTSGGIDGWYRNYTGTPNGQTFEDVPLFEVNQ